MRYRVHTEPLDKPRQSVSVISTILNDRQALERLIAALLSQTRRPDEILIVDGGSTDGTVELLKEQAAAHPMIRYLVCSGVNIAEGRNIAIRESRYGLLATTDAGCCPDSKWLEMLTRPFEEDGSVEVTSGQMLVEAHSDFEYYSGLLNLPGNLRPINPQNCRVSGRNSAFTRQVWRQAGGYPEWLYTAEDSLFRQKLREMGAKIVFVPSAIIYWRPRPTLWKFAKMSYLYGQGNGRIGEPIRPHLYNVRNYILEFMLFFLGFIQPLAWMLLGVLLFYFYMRLHRPLIRKVREKKNSWKAEVYVPLISVVRRMSYTAGVLRGWLEYRTNPIFATNLKRYLAIRPSLNET